MTTKTRALSASTATPEAGTPDLSHLDHYLLPDGRIDAHRLAGANMGIRYGGSQVAINLSDIDRLQQVAWGIEGVLYALAMDDGQVLKLSGYIRDGLEAALRSLVREGLTTIAEDMTTAAHEAEKAKRQGGAA